MNKAARAIVLAAVAAQLAMIVAVLVMRARLVDTININWDEFHYLALVHAHQRGELAARLLSFHVHVFGWVTSTSPNEALQVLRLRETMLVLSIVSAACMGFVGWRIFKSATAALLSVLAAQSFSYVLQHGTAARFDSIVSALFSLACALLVARRSGPHLAAAAGVVTALAMLFSIKSALFLPTLVALCFAPLLDDDDDDHGSAARRASFRNAAAFAASAVIAYLPLFLWHASMLSSTAANGTGTTSAHAQKSGSLLALFTGQFAGEVLPQANALLASLRWDTAFWAALLVGVALTFVGIGAGGEARKVALKVLCFALPLSSVALYRNAFPYFYVSVLPTGALLVGLVAWRIERALDGTTLRGVVAALLVVALGAASFVQALRWFRYNSDDQIAEQVRTIDVVHQVFPEPVSYLDRCSMIASFPQAGLFMTTWMLDDYRRRKKPMMPELIARKEPLFLLTNIETLELDKPYSGKAARRLLKEDFVFLRDQYIPHWGPLWVAGKTVALTATADTGEVAFNVAIPGRYVVELDNAGSVSLDGAQVASDDVVTLAVGKHRAASTHDGVLTLRIANARKAPDIAPPEGRLFSKFTFRTAPPKPKPKPK